MIPCIYSPGNTGKLQSDGDTRFILGSLKGNALKEDCYHEQTFGGTLLVNLHHLAVRDVQIHYSEKTLTGTGNC